MSLFTSAPEQDREGQPPSTRLLWMNSTRFSSTPSVLLSCKLSLCALIQAEPSAFSGPFKPSPSPHLPSSHQAGKHLSSLLSPSQYPHCSRNALEPVFSFSHRVQPALLRPAQILTWHSFLGELSSTWFLSSLKAGAFLSGSLPWPALKKKKKKKNARGGGGAGREKEEEGGGKFLKCSLWDQADMTPHQVQQQKLNHMWATPDWGEEERRSRVTVAWWPGHSVWGGGKKCSCDRDASALLREGRENKSFRVAAWQISSFPAEMTLFLRSTCLWPRRPWGERAMGPALVRILSLVWGLTDWLGLGLATKMTDLEGSETPFSYKYPFCVQDHWKPESWNARGPATWWGFILYAPTCFSLQHRMDTSSFFMHFWHILHEET